MCGEEVENEVVGVPVPYPGALVSLWWRPVLCPSLASFAFCGLQLQRSHPLRQLLGECPLPLPREGAFGEEKDGSFGRNASCLTGILVKNLSVRLFPVPSASPVSSSLPQPEPQSYPGLQRLPDGECELPGAGGLGPWMALPSPLPD